LLRCEIAVPPTSPWGQKPALPRRSIGVRFALNKQTLTERVQCEASARSGREQMQQCEAKITR
jgi:hypothetical protein